MIKIFQKKGLYTLCIQGVKNVQNLSKFKQKKTYFPGTNIDAHIVCQKCPNLTNF